MSHNAPLSATPRRTRGTVLLGLAVLGLAGALFAIRRPLMMSAPRCVAGHWHGCYDTFNGVVLMTLVAVPFSVLIAWALASWRHARGATSTWAWRRSLAEVGMVHGTVPFLWLTMMPGLAPGVAPRRVSLVPLRDLVTMGAGGIIGNLLVFAALGFFAPVRFASLASVPRVLALGAGCSVLVEVAQYVLWLDRVSSVDDVLVNATGAVLAGLASRRWWRRRGQAPSDLARKPEPFPAR
ncbi:VanZ family protein [Streptomyces sp. NPDC002667]|uniref:VanZ family protein n=1 Tax=Streptomyces sp. NPDC002667 TaxID=3364657 RepID=UPI0036AB0224